MSKRKHADQKQNRAIRKLMIKLLGTKLPSADKKDLRILSTRLMRHVMTKFPKKFSKQDNKHRFFRKLFCLIRTTETNNPILRAPFTQLIEKALNPVKPERKYTIIKAPTDGTKCKVCSLDSVYIEFVNPSSRGGSSKTGSAKHVCQNPGCKALQ